VIMPCKTEGVNRELLGTALLKPLNMMVGIRHIRRKGAFRSLWEAYAAPLMRALFGSWVGWRMFPGIELMAQCFPDAARDCVGDCAHVLLDVQQRRWRPGEPTVRSPQMYISLSRALRAPPWRNDL
jgi:hypothetical protein